MYTVFPQGYVKMPGEARLGQLQSAAKLLQTAEQRQT